MLVTPDGMTLGTVGGGALEHLATQRALALFAERRSLLVRYALGEDGVATDAEPTGMICGGRTGLFFDYLGYALRVCVLGAGHVLTGLGQEAPGAAAGIIHGLAGPGIDRPGHIPDDLTRGEKLAAVVSLLAHLQDDALRPEALEGGRDARGLVEGHPARGAAEEHEGLGLVGRQDRRRGEHLGRKRLGRGGRGAGHLASAQLLGPANRQRWGCVTYAPADNSFSRLSHVAPGMAGTPGHAHSVTQMQGLCRLSCVIIVSPFCPQKWCAVCLFTKPGLYLAAAVPGFRRYPVSAIV